MANVRDILCEKGNQSPQANAIQRIDGNATVLDAIVKMNQHLIGALVVTEGERVAGIFTERDVLRRVIAETKTPGEIRVKDVMTRDVICCGPETDLDEVSAIMKSRRIRHVPVCEPDGTVVGIISIGDVNAHYASNREQTIHYLSEYIYGRV